MKTIVLLAGSRGTHRVKVLNHGAQACCVGDRPRFSLASTATRNSTGGDVDVIIIASCDEGCVVGCLDSDGSARQGASRGREGGVGTALCWSAPYDGKLASE